jgi:hypothetical protein
MGLLSLTRGRVCRLQLLLVLASAVILGSESHGTRDHILLSQIPDFPFRRLLRLAELRWRFSIPPPHDIELSCNFVSLILLGTDHCRKHCFQQYLYCCVLIHCCGDVFVCDRCLETALHATIYSAFNQGGNREESVEPEQHFSRIAALTADSRISH